MFCSQAPKVHCLPMIVTKGGRGGKGKVLAVPIYKRMNIDTAHDLSALAREGGAHCTLHSAGAGVQSVHCVTWVLRPSAQVRRQTL